MRKYLLPASVLTVAGTVLPVSAQTFSDYLVEDSWNPPDGIAISCTAGADYWSIDGDPLFISMWLTLRDPAGRTLASWAGSRQGHIENTVATTVVWGELTPGAYGCNARYDVGVERDYGWYLWPYGLRKDTIEGTAFWGLGNYRTDLTWQVTAVDGRDWNAGGAPVNEWYIDDPRNGCNLQVQTASTYTNTAGRFSDCYGTGCLQLPPIPACQQNPSCETWKTQQIRVANADFFHPVRFTCYRAEILRE